MKFKFLTVLLFYFIFFYNTAYGKQNVQTIDFSKASPTSIEGTLDKNEEVHFIDVIVPEEGFLYINEEACMNYEYSFIDSEQKIIGPLKYDRTAFNREKVENLKIFHLQKGLIKLKIKSEDGSFLLGNDFYTYNIKMDFQTAVNYDLVNQNEVNIPFNTSEGPKVIKLTSLSSDTSLEFIVSPDKGSNTIILYSGTEGSKTIHIENEKPTIFLPLTALPKSQNINSLYIITQLASNNIIYKKDEAPTLKIKRLNNPIDDDNLGIVNPEFTYMTYDFSSSNSFEISGRIDSQGDIDIFKIIVPDQGIINFNSNSTISIIDSNKNLLLTSNNTPYLLEKGEYFILSSPDAFSGDYSINLSFGKNTDAEGTDISNPAGAILDFTKQSKYILDGVYDYFNDEDFYKIIIPGRGKLTVAVRGYPVEPTILDENGKEIKNTKILNKGTYYLIDTNSLVHNFNERKHKIKVSFRSYNPIQTDDFSKFFIDGKTPEVDFSSVSNYTFSGILNSSDSYYSFISDDNYDDVDTIKFDIPKGGRYITFNSNGLDLGNIGLLKFNKLDFNHILNNSSYYYDRYDLYENSFNFLPEGNYLIHISGSDTGEHITEPVNYKLDFSSKLSREEIEDDVREPKSIQLDSTTPIQINGNFEITDDVDTYKFTLPFKEKGKLTFSQFSGLTNLSDTTFSLFYYDKDKKKRMALHDREHFTYILLPETEYFLSLGFHTSKQYSLELKLEKIPKGKPNTKTLLSRNLSSVYFTNKSNIIDHTNTKLIKTLITKYNKHKTFKVIIPQNSFFSYNAYSDEAYGFEYKLYDKNGNYIFTHKIERGEYFLKPSQSNNANHYLYTRAIPIPDSFNAIKEIDHTKNNSMKINSRIDFKTVNKCQDLEFHDYGDLLGFNKKNPMKNTTFDTDRYKILIPEKGGILNISANGEKKCLFGQLFDDRGNLLYDKEGLLDSYNCNNEPDFTISPFLTGGIYYLDLGFIDDYGDYELNSSLEEVKEKFYIEGTFSFKTRRNDIFTLDANGFSDNLKSIILFEKEKGPNHKPFISKFNLHPHLRYPILFSLGSKQLDSLEYEERKNITSLSIYSNNASELFDNVSAYFTKGRQVENTVFIEGYLHDPCSYNLFAEESLYHFCSDKLYSNKGRLTLKIIRIE